MKKIGSSIVALVGVVVAGASFLLRGTVLAQSPAGEFLLGVAPNFAAVLLAVGGVAFLYSLIFQKSLSGKAVIIISLLAVAALAIYEFVAFQFFGARFDLWDIVASGVAAIITCVIGLAGGKKE
jgi:hypothetical protein